MNPSRIRNPSPGRTGLALLLALCPLAVPAPAQLGWPGFGRGTTPENVSPYVPAGRQGSDRPQPTLENPYGAGLQPDNPYSIPALQPDLRWRDRSPFHLGWQGSSAVIPQFYAFPTMPRGVSAYGRADSAEAPVLPPRGELSRTWPGWVNSRGEVFEGAEVERTPAMAMLVLNANRVWYRASAEDVYVPLYFYDRFRLVTAGAAVRSRNKGGFSLQLHDGGQLRSQGPARLELRSMTPEVGELDLGALTWVLATSTTRELRIVLPDRSRIEFRDARVMLEREGGQVGIVNHGPGTVRWQGQGDEVEVGRGSRLRTFFAPPVERGPSAELTVRGDAEVRTDGRVLDVREATAGTRVEWSGARWELSPGTVLRIDALAGERFPRSGGGR